MSVLLDTSIIVDLLRGKPAAVNYVQGRKERPHLSVVSVAELRAGQRSIDEARRIDAIIASYALHDVTLEIAERAGGFLKTYRKSHRLDMADVLVAATATEHGLKLATLNLKPFPMFPHLEAPY